MTEKAAMRRAVRSLCPGPEERADQSADICTALSGWPLLQGARCVAAYMALPREADLSALLMQLRLQGKRIALPKITGEAMCFREAADLDRLESGAYGVAEPPQTWPEVRPEEIDVMLVPLEAADAFGGRLGKGKGYYDRYLSQRAYPACGVALRHQMVARVPMDERDEPLDYLATPGGVSSAKAR